MTFGHRDDPPNEETYVKLSTALLLEMVERMKRMEKMLSDISADQAHLDGAVTTLSSFVDDVAAEVAALKAEVAAGTTPLDFTALDALVAKATADDPGPPAVTPPASTTPAV